MTDIFDDYIYVVQAQNGIKYHKYLENHIPGQGQAAVFLYSPSNCVSIKHLSIMRIYSVYSPKFGEQQTTSVEWINP